jgi:hypothetical protein
MTAESWRVAQIVADRGPGEGDRRGSGYLVAPGLVLTAAHVVAGASVVRVRLDVGQPGEADVQAAGWWSDPEGPDRTDLAVVMIPADVTAGRDVEPARFGRISEGMAVLRVQALGFPRFKLRSGSASEGEPDIYRDLDHVTGHAPAAANRRQGTLAVYVDDPPPAVPAGTAYSPWEGMSGAAVWSADRIIAIVAEHHSSEGTGRLTARRIDRAYAQLPDADLDRLVTWLGLSPQIGRLSDVVQPGPSQVVQSAYLAQVRDLAPEMLIDRDSELAEWAEFCAGHDAYAWWQAGPWAGKSALASWFVTHPPAGVDMISFFVTGRLAGQADSNAFLDAMIEQLNALGAAGGQPPPAAGARLGVWLSLLAGAAASAEDRGRRLVVVVDGLDEDEAGASPPRGQPSIASLLPWRPPANSRFIITSRPGPGLPDDVPARHPLSGCVPRRLGASRAAEDVEQRAKQELRDVFAADQIAIDVVGYTAGSGGGLSRSDLSALTGAAPHRLDSVLRGVFGRSLRTRLSAYFPDAETPPARVFLFAHETLRVIAEEQLGSEVAVYRQGVHDWIRSYADQGWPDSTPGYAIRGYWRLLTAASDFRRVSALARDPSRQAFLLRATGTDSAALTEIRDAQLLIAAQEVPDLGALVELAVYRQAILIRNQSIPVGLPAVWARLDRFDHAEALARAIADPYAQAKALAKVAMVAARAGDAGRADALARTIALPGIHVQVLTELAAAACTAGNWDHASRLAADAEALVGVITEPYAGWRELVELAAEVAQARNPDRASRLASDVESLAHARLLTPAQAQVLADAACISDPGSAEAAIALAFPDSASQAGLLAELAAAAVQAGDPDRAARLAGDAEALARTITEPDAKAEALSGLASAAAQSGERDRASRLAADAEALARTITDAQAHALAQLAAAAARAGDPDRAARLAAEAERLAHDITDPFDQGWTLSTLVTTAAEINDLDRAEALIRAITDPRIQMDALTDLAPAIARAGDLDRAEALARDIADRELQAVALSYLAVLAIQVGDLDRAEALAHVIADPGAQAKVITAMAATLARAGDPDGAEAAARMIIRRRDRSRALAELAVLAVQADHLDRAEALGRGITDPRDKVRVLTALAAAVQAGDQERAARLTADAEAIVPRITKLSARAQALTALAAAVQAGDQERAARLTTDAEAIVSTIESPYARAHALTALAAAAWAVDPDRGARLAADAETVARGITDLTAQARALTTLAEAAVQAGDADRAEALARAITRPHAQEQALARLAAAAAQSGDAERAGAFARAISDPDAQARAFAGLAGDAVLAGDADGAEAFARRIIDVGAQTEALTQLAAAATMAGDRDRSARLAADAESLARSIADADGQAEALAGLATVASQAGEPERARRLMALALSLETREIGWLVGVVARLFPQVIKDAGDVFLNVYASSM